VKANDVDVEHTIRQVMPAPFRCTKTSEPLFFCRHENPPGHSMILDLSSNLDGASASLTYNYDDRRRHELIASMRHFFLALRIRRLTMSASREQSGNVDRFWCQTLACCVTA
jgi:hypothetical protein